MCLDPAAEELEGLVRADFGGFLESPFGLAQHKIGQADHTPFGCLVQDRKKMYVVLEKFKSSM